MNPQQLTELRENFALILSNLRTFARSVALEDALRTTQVRQTDTPQILLQKLARIEIALTNTLSLYLQNLNDAFPLTHQGPVLNNSAILDAYLVNLYKLFDAHIETIIQAEANHNTQIMQPLMQHIVVDYDTAANQTQRDILTAVRRRVLVHCYKAVLMGGLQGQLINQISNHLAANRQLELTFNYNSSQLAISCSSNEHEHAKARINPNGRQQMDFHEHARMERINTILNDALCDTQLAEQDILILNQLQASEGRGCKLSLTVMLSETAFMNFVTNTQQHPITSNESLDRISSGILFIRRDLTPGYYPFHVLFLHELNHVLQALQGLIATDITINTLSEARWGAGALGGTGNEKTEEFRATLFNPYSEYFITEEMGLLRQRLPYVVFILPISLMRIDPGMTNECFTTALRDYLNANNHISVNQRRMVAE